MNKGYWIFVVILCIGTLFIGCSNVVPSLASVEAVVVYDYKDKNHEPQQQLSVFVQSSEDTARVMDLTIFHPDLDVQWEITSPIILSDGSKIMSGSAHLMPPYFSPIPLGQYSVNYRDLAGKSATGTFSLNYKEIDTIPFDEPIFLPKTEKEDSSSESDLETDANTPSEPIKKIALYSEIDGQGQVLFFNKLRDEWENFDSIKTSYDKAKSLRICLDYPSSQVRYILPPVNF